MAVNKEALLARRANDATREVELPSGVGSVVVRGLTRKEALSIQGREMVEAEAERQLLALALVDPVLTEAEVGAWQEGCVAGELMPVVDAVLELSGMTKDAAREAAHRFPG